MTYKRDNNDPDRTKTVLSPEEVKRMVMGCGDLAAEQPKSLTLSEVREMMRLPIETHSGSKKVGGRLRCPTCGRAFDCACGDGCTYCVDGVPHQAEGESERYAPARR